MRPTGEATLPGFTADSSLDGSAAQYGTFPKTGGGFGGLPQHPEVVPAREISDAGPKPPGNCFQICEKLELVPDTRRPELGKGGVTVYPHRVRKGSGCRWICVPDLF